MLCKVEAIVVLEILLTQAEEQGLAIKKRQKFPGRWGLLANIMVQPISYLRVGKATIGDLDSVNLISVGSGEIVFVGRSKSNFQMF